MCPTVTIYPTSIRKEPGISWSLLSGEPKKVKVSTKEAKNEIFRRTIEDEELSLSDLNMRLPFIKMNKVVASEEITEMQKKIGKSEIRIVLLVILKKEIVTGIVIGINLTELAKIGLEGVNEFRWNTKVNLKFSKMNFLNS